MKKLIIVLSLFLASCGEDTSRVSISKEEYDNLRVKQDVPEYPKKIKIDDRLWNIINFDECEYMIYDIAFDRGLITHKGNCKFCQQRLRKTIQEELKKQNEK